MTTETNISALCEPGLVPPKAALLVVREDDAGVWRIVSLDAGITALLGYPIDELIGSGHDLIELVHENDLPAVEALCEGVPAVGTGSCPCRFRAHDGSWCRVELSMLVGDRDANGRPTQLIVSLTDVDPLAQVRGVLVLNERVLEMIAKGSTMQEVLSELCACTERFVDDAFCTVMLTSPEGPLRVAAGPSLPPEAIEAFDGLAPGARAACCGTAVYTGKPVYIADVHTDPRWTEYAHIAERFRLQSGWSVPIRSDTGEILGSFGICRTITGLPSPIQIQLMQTASHLAGITIMRDALEQQRHESLTRYQAIFETARDAIFLKDGQGRYLAINPAMAKLFDQPVDQVIGHTDTEMFDNWSIGFVRAVDERVMAGETVEVQHARSVRGQEMIFDVIKVPLRDAQGKVVGICGIARDITERVRAKDRRQEVDKRIQRAQRLERLGLFAGGIAHDFGNLMLGIRGNTEVLRRLLSGDQLDAVRDAIARIDESVEMASALTGRMLAYTGRGRLALERVDLGTIARETIRMIRPAIAETIDLNCVVERGLPTIIADPVQMRQVIMNLVTNAAEAIGDARGSVLVRVGPQSTCEQTLTCVCVGSDLQAERAVLIEVADDGPGIPIGDRQRIFEPFFSTKQDGRGLGLAAVVGIVKAHQGVVCLDEAPSGGARLRIYLPADHEPVDDASDHATHAAAAILDDEPR